MIVTREDFDPHYRHAEVAIVDTADREPQHLRDRGSPASAWPHDRLERKLMVKKADWLGPEMRIDVTLYSALKWQPDED